MSIEPLPTSITLNAEQQAACDAIEQWLAGSEPVFVLTGYAGTGKTTTIQHAVANRPHTRICMSAPTHKAVGVLAARSPLPGSDAKTIHSLLGCRARWVEDERIFEPDPDKWSWDDYDLVVLDEVSMVGDTIWSWIQDAQELQRTRLQQVTRVICLGDPAQLPPVKDGDGLSPAFELETPGAHLETIMRHQGLVERAATTVRQHLADVRAVPIEFGDTVTQLTGKPAFFKAWLECQEVSDDLIILAWRNDTVDWFNTQCRQRVYGHDVPDIPQPGELRVMRDTHPDGFGGFIHTGTQVIVEQAKQATWLDIPCWHVRTASGHDLYALRPDTAPLWRQKRNKARKAKDWSTFRQLTDAFCRLRPGYATTIHKSQGSTYGHVFVIERDLMACRDHLTRNMLRYVAYSRAREALYIA